MELGIIGFRMGANMTERLVVGGHRLISFDRSPEAIQRIVHKGALGAHSLGGEGRWTVEEAIERSVPVPVLMLSLFARFTSRQEDSFSAKVIAALRNEFGGHAVKKG
jgi:6-phosphogluconate dehydrogenase (decarboxylating)